MKYLLIIALCFVVSGCASTKGSQQSLDDPFNPTYGKAARHAGGGGNF